MPQLPQRWWNNPGVCVYIGSQSFSVGVDPYYSWFNNTILLAIFSSLYHFLTPLLVHPESLK